MTAILGGGISGLSAAYYLLKNKFHPVSLFESSQLVGGWIQSQKQENGIIFEQGPRTIRPRGIPGANTLELLEELQLESKVKPIGSSHPAALNRLICVNNELHKLPSGLIDLFKVNPPFSKSLISHILHDLRATKVEKSDDTCYEFINRRFGNEIAEYMISALLCGICAGDSKEISVKFLMKYLFEMEQKYGSVIIGAVIDRMKNGSAKSLSESRLVSRARKERWSVYSLEGGLAILPKTLQENISANENCKLQVGAVCYGIEFDKKSVKLRINDEELTFNHLVSALSSHDLAPLLKKQHPILAEELMRIPFVHVAVINLAFKQNFLKQPAFGFLVPPSQKLPILGVIYDSCCFDMKDQTVLTVMMGGRWFDQYFGSEPTKTELLDIALTQINRTLKVDEKPYISKVSILRNCIAQYVVGHEERVKNINKYIQDNQLPISLVGASYHGVGINDVILSAKLGVQKLISL